MTPNTTSESPNVRRPSFLYITLGVVSAALFALGVWFPVIKTTTGYTYSIVGTPAIVMYGIAITLLIVNVFQDKFTRDTATRMLWLAALAALLGSAYSGYIANAGMKWFYYQTAVDMPSWGSVDQNLYWQFINDKGYNIKSWFGDLQALYRTWGPNVTYNEQTVFLDAINGMSLADVKALVAVTGPGVTPVPFGLSMALGSLCIQVGLALRINRRRAGLIESVPAPAPALLPASAPSLPQEMNDCPAGVKGWSWGAFLLNWIWAIGNRTWIGLLALIPGVSIVIAIILGFKGREWAWRNKSWSSVEEFNRIQKKWAAWGVGIWIGSFALTFVYSFGTTLMERLEQRKNMVREVQQTGGGAQAVPQPRPVSSTPLPEQDSAHSSPAKPGVVAAPEKPENAGEETKPTEELTGALESRKAAKEVRRKPEPVQAQDCAKRPGATARIICSTPEVAATEHNLNAIYNQALNRVKDKKALAREQAAWRRDSLERCQTANCMLQKYNERISELAIKELY